MIAHDIGNFADENLTVAQVNALIERTRQDREVGRVPQPQLQLAPGVQLINGAAVRPVPRPAPRPAPRAPRAASAPAPAPAPVRRPENPAIRAAHPLSTMRAGRR